MKAFTLLFLRVATGLLLVLWGLIKTMSPDAALHVSDTYYHGVLSMHALQMPLGIAEIILGVMVVVGLWRRVTLPLQALVLCIGALVVWNYVLDPLGQYFVAADARKPLFFPSLTVAAATLVQIAFREFDTLALDHVFKRKAVDQSAQ